MGRRYSAELEELAETYRWARLKDGEEISALTESIKALRGRPLVAVASGGSLSACTFAARLHETHARLPARVLTPFEFIHHPVPQAAGVLLLSASGGNPDVLAAARHATACEYSPVVGVCTHPNTKLKALLVQYRHAAVFEFVGPSKKDGFLATNSLLLTCTLLAQAYGIELPDRLPALEAGDDADYLVGADALGVEKALSRPYVLALADGWALAAALDLESKWSESGFGSVTVTDVRNFAHGRHHGLSRRLNDTLVLGLAVATEGYPGASAATERRLQSDDVLAKALAHLPQGTAVSTLRSPLAAEAGALDLLVRVLYLTGEAGRLLGLDPGRPRVPAFGRKLYRAGVPRRLLQHAQEDGTHCAEDLWIRRKVTPVVWAGASEQARETWRESCRSWRSAAEAARVGGVVLDYDGTLCEAEERFGKPSQAVGDALTRLLKTGMVIGVATGRGDSIFDALRAVIPIRLWPDVIVGMYNGALRFRLAEDVSLDLVDSPPQEAVAQAYAILATTPILNHIADFRMRPTQQRPTQLSIHETRSIPEGLLRRVVVEALYAAMPDLGVDVVASDHSVDVIPRGVSKLEVVTEVERVLAEAGRTNLSVMTIGDQGQAGGNDASFLARPLGLSVEHASSDFGGCWNVAPRGARRTVALLGYLGALQPRADGGFRWSVTQASRQLQPHALRRATPGATAEGVVPEEAR